MGTDGRSRERIGNFEDLEVWRTGREIVCGVYRASVSQRLRDDFAMLNQMKRAAISIRSNIAEGFERGTRKQHIEFCYVAKGSAGELRTQVMLAHDVGLLDDSAHEWLMERCDKCSRQLARYLRHLKKSRATIPGAKFVEHERTDNVGSTAINSHLAEDDTECGRDPVPTSPPPHVPTPQGHAR